MRTTLYRSVGVLLILGGLFITTASAQDFQKSYTIRAGGRINIHARSGPVTIAGYDGEAVIVKGFRSGRDRDVVKIEDLSSPNSVDVRDRYPEIWVQSRLGTGSGSVRLESMSGNVSLTQLR